MDINQLILRFFLHHCHPNTSKAFLNALSSGMASSKANQCLLQTLQTRFQILERIRSGDPNSALKLLELHFPSFMEHTSLVFALYIQCMLELLLQGNALSALEWVQGTLLPMTKDSPALHHQLGEIVGVLAYEDVLNSPFAGLFAPGKREELAAQVADELFRLCLLKQEEDRMEDAEASLVIDSLEMLVKHAFCIHKELGKKEEFQPKGLVK